MNDVRLAALRSNDGTEVPAIVHPVRGVARVCDLPLDGPWAGLPGAGDVMALLDPERWAVLTAAAEAASAHVFRDPGTVAFGAPYRAPRLLWGIGLNYVEHAADLSEGVPTEPASFIKGSHTIIGPGEDIPVPRQSERTTAEAELGLVIGSYCRDVEPEQALDHVAAVVPVLDQTAEDILQRNPRFLTRSKNFCGFFSFGPQLVPLAEAIETNGGLGAIEVSTVINGEVHRANTVDHMRYDPAYLVSFHSKVFPLRPGDVLSTGTPGAVVIRPGDRAEARVSGVGTLVNPVVAG